MNVYRVNTGSLALNDRNRSFVVAASHDSGKLIFVPLEGESKKVVEIPLNVIPLFFDIEDVLYYYCREKDDSKIYSVFKMTYGDKIIQNKVEIIGSFDGFRKFYNSTDYLFGVNKNSSGEIVYRLLDFSTGNEIFRSKDRFKNSILLQDSFLSFTNVRKKQAFEEYSLKDGALLRSYSMDVFGIGYSGVKLQVETSKGLVMAFLGGFSVGLFRFNFDKNLELLYTSNGLVEDFGLSSGPIDVIEYQKEKEALLLCSFREIFLFYLETKRIEILCRHGQAIAEKVSFFPERIFASPPRNGPFLTDRVMISFFLCRNEEESYIGIYVYDRLKREVVYVNRLDSIVGPEGTWHEYYTFLHVSKEKLIVGLGDQLIVKEGHDIPLY